MPRRAPGPGSGAECPSSWETGCGRKGGRPLARHATHVRGEPGAKPFVDDLLLGRGFVRSRAAPSLRSIESQPSTQGFVRARARWPGGACASGAVRPSSSLPASRRPRAWRSGAGGGRASLLGAPASSVPASSPSTAGGARPSGLGRCPGSLGGSRGGGARRAGSAARRPLSQGWPCGPGGRPPASPALARPSSSFLRTGRPADRGGPGPGGGGRARGRSRSRCQGREARGDRAPGQLSARGRVSFGPPGLASCRPTARTLRRAARLVRGRPLGPLAGVVWRDGTDLERTLLGVPRHLSEVDQLPPASSGLSRWLAHRLCRLTSRLAGWLTHRLLRSTSRRPVAVPLGAAAQLSKGGYPRFTARAAFTGLGLRCRWDHAEPLLYFFQPHLQFAFSGL